MAWIEIMTSAHAALARAEWAVESDRTGLAAQELRIATAQAMLAWLKAHRPDSPIWYDYASVVRDFGAAANTGATRSLLRLHFRAANLDAAFQGAHHGPVTGLAMQASSRATREEVWVALEAGHGTVRALEEEMLREEQCGD